MNLKLRTFRGNARMADLCLKGKKDNLSTQGNLNAYQPKENRHPKFKLNKLLLLGILCCFWMMPTMSFAQTSAPALAYDIQTTGDGHPYYLTEFNGKLYFNANDGTNGRELWVYDGTTATMVHDINSSGEGNPREFAVYNGKLYFKAYDGTNGNELWVYDGVNTPTMVYDLNSSGSSSPEELAVYNGKLYFKAYDGSSSRLWEYDGINNPIQVSSAFHSPKEPAVYNGKLYFNGTTTGTGEELWVYDGTNPPTKVNSPGVTRPSNLTVYNGKLYFNARDGSNFKLWEYDGTNTPPTKISGSQHNFSYLTVYDGQLYFSAHSSTYSNDVEPHRFDGTSISMVANIQSGNGIQGCSYPRYFTVYNNKLYFSAKGPSGRELYEYDVTNGLVLHDINPGWQGTDPVELAVANGKLYFNADDGINGHELWTLNTTPPSQFGQSGTITLDGHNQYISTTNPNFYMDNFTIEGWFKTEPNITEGAIVSVYNPINNGAAITVQINTDVTKAPIGTLRGTMRTTPSGTGGINVYGTALVNDGNWHHFALVRKNDDKIHLYIDGVFDQSSINSQTDIGNNTYTLNVGRNIPVIGLGPGSRYFEGELDEIRLWDKTLTDSEISANYNIELPNPTTQSNLVVYYDFNAISGSTVPDESSNSNIGTIQPVPAPVSFDVDFNAQPICADATEWLVPIDVGAATADIAAISFVIDYDNTKLTYDALESVNPNLTGATLDNTGNLLISDNNGKITISWINTTPAAISNATILTLKFVPANGAADFSAIAGQTTDFTWDETITGNCEFSDNAFNILNATFNDQTGATVNAAPTAGLTSDATNNTTLCAGDNVTFTATGGISYSFDINGGTPVAGSGAGSDEFQSSTLADGDVVTVTVTDANGCSSTASLTMVVNPLPTAGLTSDATNNTTLCAGDDVTFTGTGGTSYSFDVDGGTPVAGTGAGSDEFSTTALTNGQVVTVTVTDANGCSASTSLTMVVNPLPSVVLSSDDADNTICAGDAVTFTGSGATSYSFDVNGGTPVAGAGANSDEFSSATLANGDVVTVTGTNANGCINTASITMTVNPLPTAGLTSDKAGDAVCIGETITFTGTGGATYEFLVDAGSGYTTAQAASADASYDVNTLVNGDKVKVTVTNANGCVATSSEITVTVNPLPTTTLASDDADSRVCQGQVVTFTATSASADEFIFYVNAVEVQAQSADATYEYTTGTDGDVITVVGVNTTSGCSQIAAETFTMDVDGCHSLSGNLLYKNSAETPMGNVVITITGPGLAPNTTITTDNTGSFAIDNLFDTETYNFAYATTKSHSGTNSTDALKALAEATNQTTLTGLYLAAADVSQSSGVTSADALEIQRRFVFVTSTAFTGGLDWVFEAGSFTPNGGDITGQKLYALAMGDINGSYTPNIMENGTPTVSMINDGQMVVNNGDRVQIPVRIKNGENVGAMSLSMYFPSNAMTVHDITSDNGTSLLNNVNGDEIRMAWADINAKLFADDDVVYYIDATINDVALYNAAPLGINLVSELANAIGTVLEDVTLGIPTINATITNTNSIEAAAASVRSFPNPFSNQMTIEYDLPSTSQVAIQMYNSLGQEIATLVNESQQEGTHRAIWNADNKAAGVYFYTITVTEGTNSYKKTKQVILVK